MSPEAMEKRDSTLSAGSSTHDLESQANVKSSSEYIKEEAELSEQNLDRLESKHSPNESVGLEDEIIWHYLTFNTPLPTPAHVSLSHLALNDRAPPLEPPNLKKYENPFNWSRSRKRFMSWFGCISTTICAYSAGAYAVGEQQITTEFHVSDPAFEVGITVFTCGFAMAPMFLAPFSEINGRRPVFVATGVLFTLFQLTCALVPNFGGLLAARFLVGCSASTFSTMVGGVIADFYEAKDRNWALSIFTGGAIFGTGLGPLCSGFIAQHLDWRWIFRVQAISNGLLVFFIVLFFKESRGSILLSRRAKAINKWYDDMESLGYYGVLMPNECYGAKESSATPQRIRWKVRADEERASLSKMLRISLVRPFHMLVTEPILFFFSLWITFAWACLYLLFSAVPLIFQTRYGFDIAQTGAVFSTISIASLISTVLAVYQEKVARMYVPEKWQPWLSTPEGRLFFSCAQSALLPIGSFWYGWSSFSNIPWVVPALGVGCATMGVFSVYLAVFNYLSDIYMIYASSALAAQSFCRNMAAGVFPIFVVPMFVVLMGKSLPMS